MLGVNSQKKDIVRLRSDREQYILGYHLLKDLRPKSKVYTVKNNKSLHYGTMYKPKIIAIKYSGS